MPNIPGRSETWKMLTSFIGDHFVVARELSDEEGLYLWEIEAEDPDGSEVLYCYMRSGQFPEGFSTESQIDKIYLDSGRKPIGGEHVAEFRDGKWVILL